jgi:chromosome segregation ATPase
MANDKYYGYSPKKETRKPSTGVTDVGTRLDRVNPYEFRKGMDVELTSLGVSRLQESTPEEREKATETVLKNLEAEFRNSDSKPNFKTFLKEFYGDTAMKEVTDKKDNQMEEPKYDKKTYTTEFKGATEQLKEAIKKEVVSLLSEEDDDKKMDKDAAKSAKKGSKAKIAKQIDKLAKERKDKEEKRQEFFDAYKKTKKDKKATEAYKKKVTPLQDRIKDIDKEVKDLENELAGLKQEEKDMRREAAGMMMDKKVHLEILKMIKEVGVPMTETAGVKMYYEVAKMAYMEGLTAGMSKE